MRLPLLRPALLGVATLATLGLLAQLATVLYRLGVEPDAAVVLEGDPQRIRFAAQLAKTRPELPIYISSEPVFYSVYLDALADEQVPIERFALRTCATDTVTNFTCVVDELKAQGYRHLYVITSAHHMRRALTVARIVLGCYRMAASPLPVADGRGSRESLPRTLRDALRAILWSITGFAGPEKAIR